MAVVPAWKKPGLTGYPASTESSALQLNVFPQSIYSAQWHSVVPEVEVNLFVCVVTLVEVGKL